MHPSRPWSLLSFLVKLDPKQVLLAASRSCCSRKLLEELGAGDRSLVRFLENLEKFCPLVMSSPLIVLSNHWRNYFLENVGVVGGNPSWIPMMLSGFSRKCTLHLSYWIFFGSWLITLPPRGFMMLHGSMFFFEKLGCFFQDEARFLWGDVIFWEYAQWFRTKTLYIFVQLPARIHPRFVPTFIQNILTYVSFMGPTPSVFPGFLQQESQYSVYVLSKADHDMGNPMEPAVGVSPLHGGVTLATNRPTWKSTMVATWRAAGCVPAYRDGQVDYGMGRRDTERTGASFLSFFFRGRSCGKCYFFCLCFVVVDRGGGFWLCGSSVLVFFVLVDVRYPWDGSWFLQPLAFRNMVVIYFQTFFCHRSLQSMIGVIGMRDLFWKTLFFLYFLPK